MHGAADTDTFAPAWPPPLPWCPSSLPPQHASPATGTTAWRCGNGKGRLAHGAPPPHHGISATAWKCPTMGTRKKRRLSGITCVEHCAVGTRNLLLPQRTGLERRVDDVVLATATRRALCVSSYCRKSCRVYIWHRLEETTRYVVPDACTSSCRPPRLDVPRAGEEDWKVLGVGVGVTQVGMPHRGSTRSKTACTLTSRPSTLGFFAYPPTRYIPAIDLSDDGLPGPLRPTIFVQIPQ
jgi:hypothetical protein